MPGQQIVDVAHSMTTCQPGGLAASMISGGPSLGVGAIAQTVVTAVGAGVAAAYAGGAALKTGRAAGRLGGAGVSQIARAGQARGELQLQATSARQSPSAATSVAQSRATAPTASGSAAPSTASKIRSDVAGASRGLGRAGLAAGVAIPRSDGSGGNVNIDLSDRK